MNKGILSDASIKAMCAIHQAVPLNRLDILLPVPTPTNGIYNPPLGEPNYLERPSNIADMINNLGLPTDEAEILRERYRIALATAPNRLRNNIRRANRRQRRIERENTITNDEADLFMNNIDLTDIDDDGNDDLEDIDDDGTDDLEDIEDNLPYINLALRDGVLQNVFPELTLQQQNNGIPPPYTHLRSPDIRRTNQELMAQVNNEREYMLTEGGFTRGDIERDFAQYGDIPTFSRPNRPSTSTTYLQIPPPPSQPPTLEQLASMSQEQARQHQVDMMFRGGGSSDGINPFNPSGDNY